MSRLSRFKKGAALKLPPMKTKTVQCNSESDDDFQEKIPSLPLRKHNVAITGVSVEKPTTSTKTTNANTVESIYFNSDGNVAIAKSGVGGEYQQEDGKQHNPHSKKSRPTKQMAKKEELLLDTISKEFDNEESSDSSSKVVCPFCWKKLSDKLSGTTHVKSCGKNLPTERIFEALQLHEKQVKEWEGLGIAYPGFANPATGKAAKTKKPRSRPKKPKDPELELAMALSVSLHEEIEIRKLKEKEFLVESGLEKEVEKLELKENKKDGDLLAPPVSYRQRAEKKAKLKLPKMLSGQDIGIGKRRGKKDVNLTGTKLYTTSETERQNIINERVGLILEESSSVVLEEFYVRDKVNIPEEIPKRLKAFHKENSPLWKLAELDNESGPADAFIIQDVVDSKARNEKEMAQAAVPENNHMPSRTELVSENNRMNSLEKPFSLPESFPLPSRSNSAVQSKYPAPKIDKKNIIEVPRVPTAPLTHKPRFSPNSSVSISSDGSASQRGNSEAHLPGVVHDLMRMLSKRLYTDIILFGREEKPIKCHKLLLSARCPKILEDVVEARSSTSGTARELISLVGYSHNVVKAFVTFVYSGIIRRSLTAEELIELNALADKYDLPLIPDEPPAKRVKTADMEIQTESVTIDTNSSFTQTEDMEFKEPISNEENARDISVDIFDISEVSDTCKRNSSVRKSRNDSISSNPVFDDSSDKLFQNLSENPCEAQVLDEVIIDEDNGNVSEDLFGDYDDEDNDAFLNQVANNLEERENPSTLAWENMNAKKRTRSISELSNSSATSFTATQVAQYWRKQINKNKLANTPMADDNETKDSRSDTITSPSPKKSSKKYKANSDDSESENERESSLNRNIDEAEVIVIDDSDNETIYGTQNSPKEKFPADIKKKEEVPKSSEDVDMSLSWEDTYANANADMSVGNDICEDVSIIESPINRISNVCETPKNTFSNRNSTRLSVENVRNHSIGNLNYSPLGNLNSPSYSPLKSIINSKMSIVEQGTPNPFGEHDDSVFAKIPEEMLNNPLDNHYAFTSERELSPSTSDVCDKSNRKGRGKAKAKGGSKNTAATKKDKSPSQNKRNRKGHRGYSFSQEPEPSCKTPPTVAEIADGRTPMLNYSTIDTPILKNELKRFGLKPLPRSKAKVMLRHIYKETHK